MRLPSPGKENNKGREWVAPGMKLKTEGAHPHPGSRNDSLSFLSSLYPRTNFCLHGNKNKIKHTAFSLRVSGGVSLVSFCHIFIRIRRLFAVNFSLPERNSRDFSVSPSQAYIIPIYEIVAKAKSSKKTTDRWCIGKMMRIEHACLLQKEEK